MKNRFHITYFHGFNSASKKGQKYQVLRDVFQQEIYIPDLDYTSDLLFEETAEFLSNIDGDKIFIGTSLGGYMAMYYASITSSEAWVFNPTTKPHESLKKYLGTQKNFVTKETYEWKQKHLEKFQIASDSIKDLELNPSHIKVCVGTKDDVISPNYTIEYFEKLNISVRQYQDDHRFTKCFERAILDIKADITP